MWEIHIAMRIEYVLQIKLVTETLSISPLTSVFFNTRTHYKDDICYDVLISSENFIKTIFFSNQNIIIGDIGRLVFKPIKILHAFSQKGQKKPCNTRGLDKMRICLFLACMFSNTPLNRKSCVPFTCAFSMIRKYYCFA